MRQGLYRPRKQLSQSYCIADTQKMVVPKPPILPFPGGPWAGPGGAHTEVGVRLVLHSVLACGPPGLSNLPGNSSWRLSGEERREVAGASWQTPLVATRGFALQSTP